MIGSNPEALGKVKYIFITFTSGPLWSGLVEPANLITFSLPLLLIHSDPDE